MHQDFYKNEKLALLPFMVATPVLFLLGGMLVYYLIMPLAIEFFLSFEKLVTPESLPIQLEAKVNEYLSLITRLIIAFGLSFQLPVLLTLLAKVGFVDAEYLRKRRKYIIIIIFSMAAVLTPPDPITQIGLALPLLLLYELSIFTVKIVEKKMILVKFIRENKKEVINSLNNRQFKNSDKIINEILVFDEKYRENLESIQKLQNKRNIISKELSSIKKNSKEFNIKSNEVTNLKIKLTI